MRSETRKPKSDESRQGNLIINHLSIMKTNIKAYTLIGLMLLCVTSCDKKDPEPGSSASDIVTFMFNGLSPAVAATIDAAAKTVIATLPAGTDATKLVPTITVSDKAAISPASNVAQDFSKPVTYTVTAEDGSTQGYIVNIKVTALPLTITNVSPNSGRAGDKVVITGANFNTALGSNVVKFNGKPAKIITGNAATLTVEVPEKAGIGTITVETNAQRVESGQLFNFLYSATTGKVAGGFKNPQNICMDGKGNIYVPDRINGKIIMIKPDGSKVNIAGTTPAPIYKHIYNVKGSLARFAVITGLAVDAAGENLYAVDEYNLTGFFGGYVLKIDLTTTNYFVQQLGQYQSGHPTNIRLDETNKLLYINSFTKSTLAGFVQTMKTDGTDLTTLIGNRAEVGFNPVSAGEIDGLSARLIVPAGGFLSKDGRFYYFTDEFNHAIRVYDTGTKKVKTLAGTGLQSQTFLGEIVSNANAKFAFPRGITLDSEGRIYVTESSPSTTKSLRIYDPKSDKWQTLLTGLKTPYCVIINDKDELFISEWSGTDDSILKVIVK